jgi:8-amino-7-oxononanoate synthase
VNTDAWLDDIHAQLRELEARSLGRSLRELSHDGRFVITTDGRRLLNLASNDYLALSHHPMLAQAVAKAAQDHGTGAGASRLVAGHTSLHAQVERRFALFKHAQAALICPTGYMANLAAVTSLAGEGDLICLDKLNHASLIDAARASGATVRVYPHGDLAKLDRLLSKDDVAGKKLIVTDSVFSMDGDIADLPALCDLADRYDAILIVDEAHGSGVLGQSGAGLAELQNVSQRVDVVVSTASKALGSLGGVVTAKAAVIDLIVNRGRAFIFTTGVPPTQLAAIDAALDVVRDEPWRRLRVLELSASLRSELSRRNWRLPPSSVPTPIVPLITGSAESALALSAHLSDRGFFAPAIRPPTVAPGAARVRLSLRADIGPADLISLLAALDDWSGHDDCIK